MPNPEQVKSAIRWLMAAGGPLGALFLSKGVSQSDLAIYSELAIAIVPPVVSFIWSQFLAHSDKGTLAAVASVPGASVQVNPFSTSAGARAAAADPALPHVTLAP